MNTETLQQQLVERLQSGDFSGLKQVLGTLTPVDFAEAIMHLPAEEQAVLFRLLPPALQPRFSSIFPWRIRRN